MLVAALLLLSSFGEDNSEAVRAEIGRCGVAPEQVYITYSPLLEDLQVDIFAAEVPETTLVCLAEVPGVMTMSFRDAGLTQRYAELHLAVIRRVGRQLSEEWLRDHGKLDTVPRFATGTSPIDVAQGLERFCGVELGSVFDVQGAFLALRGPPIPAVDCIIAALGVTDLDALGYGAGFIASETVAVPE